MAPHPIPLFCALVFSPPSHRDATTTNPCWDPHLMTRERIMFSNPNPAGRASLPPRQWATTRCRLSLCLCAAFLSCSLQPLLKFSLLSLRQSLFQFVSIVSILLNHGNPIFEPVYVFLPFLFCLCVSDRNKLQLHIPVCDLVVITRWQRFHYYSVLP